MKIPTLTEVQIVTSDGLNYYQGTNELITGTFEFHENGQLTHRGTYIDGKHNGLW